MTSEEQRPPMLTAAGVDAAAARLADIAATTPLQPCDRLPEVIGWRADGRR